MKQVCNSSMGILVREFPLPTPGDKEILVATKASVISSGTETASMNKENGSVFQKLTKITSIIEKAHKICSEQGLQKTLEIIKNNLEKTEQNIFLSPIGYSNAGYVVAKGRLVNDFNVGDKVACCGSGIASHAEFCSIPINLAAKIPPDVSYIDAAFSTIGSIAMQGIRRANLSFGETIVITGLGLIGLLAVKIAKAWGLSVIGIDTNPQKIDLAKSMGADYCFIAGDNTIKEEIFKITYGYGADAVLIYAKTDSSYPVNQAFSFCRKKGRVVVIGSVGMDLQRDEMYKKELDFVISTSYGPGRYDNLYEKEGFDYPIGYVRWTENRNMVEFLHLLSKKLVSVKDLISHIYSIEEAQEAYRSLVEKKEQMISCVFQYSHTPNEDLCSKQCISTSEPLSSKIKVGIIGGGSFIQKTHLASIKHLPTNYQLIAIANKTPLSATNIGHKFGAYYVTTDYMQILNDPNVDMVIIGTRHNLHARQVIDSINAGKHILVEKPLAMSRSDLEQIKNAAEQHPELHIAVGFNRRYSPLIQNIIPLLRNNVSPIVVNYRVNAGFYAPNVWVQDLNEGGGRLVGEGCHFIDLISYLVNSEIVSYTAVASPLSETNQSEDNFIISLLYKNGSIGVLTYSSLGSKNQGKELIEIFHDNSSIVIDDFSKIHFFNKNMKDVITKTSDKGHFAELREFAKLLKGEESMILPFKYDIATTNTIFGVLDTIHSI